MTQKTVSEVERLIAENEGQSSSKSAPANGPETLVDLRREVDTAIQKVDEVCTTAEATLTDAYLKLETYATGKLPLLIRTNIEALAQTEMNNEIKRILGPLDECVGAVLLDLEKCQSKLNEMVWTWRLLLGQVATGFLAALVGGCLIYFGLFGDMRRYATWGEKAALKIENYSPKTRDMLFQDLGRP